MKKLLLSIAAFTAAHFAFAQCSELFFSEYVEGYNNNKALEIYNPTANAISLNSNYRLIRWSNGSTTADMDINYVQSLTGTIQPYSTFTLFLDKRNPSATGADTILEASLLAIANSIVNAGNGAFISPDYNANVEGAKMMPFNGDDALSLQKKNGSAWSNVDIFGKIGEQPTNGSGQTSPSGGWTDTPPYSDGQGPYVTKDKTLIRKNTVTTGVSANPALFNALAEWDSLPVGTYSNIGMHSCVCASTRINEATSANEIQVYPNPNSGRFVISSGRMGNTQSAIKKVEIVNVVGETVLTEFFPAGGRIEIGATLAPGIYFIKAGNAEKTVTKKITVY